MNCRWFSQLMTIIGIVITIVTLQRTVLYAQAAPSGADEVSVTQHFQVAPQGDGTTVNAAEATTCGVTADLRWYRKKRVRVLYHWQDCPATPVIRWALHAIRNADGSFMLSSPTGSQEVYDLQWDELQAGDTLTLMTWIDGAAQATVSTTYQDKAPVWPRIHTRQDANGACFQFTGENDPWAVFTAGDQRYTFFLGDDQWETPWLAGPATATVDWHVALYGNEALTRLRAEYTFNDVPNPCHTPVLSCSGVELTPDQALPIVIEGQRVEATIHGENSTEYRIIDQSGTVVAGPTTEQHLSFHALPQPNTYQAQVGNGRGEWQSSESCGFVYIPVNVAQCSSVTPSIPTTQPLERAGAAVTATVDALDTQAYRLVRLDTGEVVGGPSTAPQLEFHALPAVFYQAEVSHQPGQWLADPRCKFHYDPQPPACVNLTSSLANGSAIPSAGTEVEITVVGRNATQYRLMQDAQTVMPPHRDERFTVHVMPGVTYRAEVSEDGKQWATGASCYLRYSLVDGADPVCMGVELSVANRARIPTDGMQIDVKVHGIHSTRYRLLRAGVEEVTATSNNAFSLYALPGHTYLAQVAADDGDWITSEACQFVFEAGSAPVAACSLGPRHYGDPGGLSDLRAWIVGDESRVVPISSVRVNWNNKGTVTYPTAKQQGPWFTSIPFVLNSRPEVWDIGFGRYHFEAWVYVEGVTEPAYCQGSNEAPDHDNVLPDPGPFAQDNPEGKFNRGSEPSRLPTVGRVPFDGGNGTDKVELILWAFEKAGHGVKSRITAIANGGKPLARLGMSSVSNQVKFDGLNARPGLVYGFQIGEHGPWSPLFCPAADSNPTTITVYWGAGGMTWLSDGAAYGDCWWLTVAAARQGWVTVDETVATYNALQPIIDWHGHRNLLFSWAQSRETGLGPRMQDVVIGLQAIEWQGAVIPNKPPADFEATVAAYRQRAR